LDPDLSDLILRMEPGFDLQGQGAGCRFACDK
jgi:hypothetical protein